jgi:galactokinase
VATVSAFAPGRVELLGNHTDYNGGSVLSAAIPYGVTATGSLRSDGEIKLATEFGGKILHHRPRPGEAFARRGDWPDYPLGVLEVLKERGLMTQESGFEVSYSSTLPVGAGLSSSAALEISTILLLARLFDFSLSGMEFAKFCRRAENHYVGVPSGILDQVSSLFGKRDRAVLLNCRSMKVSTIAFPHEVTLLLIQSGVPHALVGGEYEERRRECLSAARLLGVPLLCDATSAMFAASNLPDPERRRAAHVIGEKERVLQTAELLAGGNVAEVGRLMTASHESSRVNFENSTPLLDLLVSLAISAPGVLGARLTGGGFGGAIVVLLLRSAASAAGAFIVGEYARQSGHQATLLGCDLADGALALNGFTA